MQRRSVLLGLCSAGLGMRQPRAGGFPDHSLTLILPFGQATHVGMTALLLRPYLEAALHQRIQFDLHSGGDGESGHNVGAAATADGYTMTIVSSSLVLAYWRTTASVATPDSFRFLGQITEVPNVLLVRADSPLATAQDLVVALRARPASLATGGQPSWWPTSAFTRALFCQLAGIQPRIDQSYYSTSELLFDLERGQLDFAVAGTNDLRAPLPLLGLRALAVSSATRLPALPDAPTFREQGWDVTTQWWHGLAVPKATPAAITARLAGALSAALASPDLRSDFARYGLTVDPLDGTSLTQRVADEFQAASELFTALGLNRRVHKPT